MQTDEISGVFALDLSSGKETRLLHTSDYRISALAVGPEGIACSLAGKAGTSNLAAMHLEGSDPQIITEGDSVDLHPIWDPSRDRTLIFQSAGRARDFAIRAALGASRPQLIRQLLLENFLLALAGGVLGLLAAVVVTSVLAPHLFDGKSALAVFEFDWRVLGFALSIALLAGLLSGGIPAWLSSCISSARRSWQRSTASSRTSLSGLHSRSCSTWPRLVAGGPAGTRLATTRSRVAAPPKLRRFSTC